MNLPAEVFMRHLRRLMPEVATSGSLAPVLTQLDLEGLYLACACVHDVPSAIEVLEHHYLTRLPSALGYLKLPPAVLDDVCQMVRTHLLLRSPGTEPRLARYTGRGSLLSWIRVIAVRMALKQGTSARDAPEDGDLAAIVDLPAPGADAELELLKRRSLHEFRQALSESFSSLSGDQRYLLRLHFIDRLPTTRMAPLFGKDQSTISRWLKEAREKVYEETKHRLRKRLRLSSEEFESLMETLKSRFDMSLSQFLNEEGEEA